MPRRQSAAVYRRRRRVFFGGILVLVLLLGGGVWAVIAQPWSDAAPTASSAAPETDAVTPSAEPSAEPSTDPAAEPSAEPSVAPTPEETSGVAACTAGDVQVTALTDAETYADGILPQLSLSLTNTSDADCTIDVGTSTQQFTVTSGNDVWWRSTDCQSEPSSMVVTLTAGQTVQSATPVAWDRTRSSVETCGSEGRSQAPGGGASYHLAVSIGGFASAETRQFFLY